MSRNRLSVRPSRRPTKRKTPLSKAGTYEELSAFWDEHDFTEFGVRCRDVTGQFEVDIRRVRHYVAIEPDALRRASRLAQKRGISTERLINMWVREASKRA